MDLLLTDPPYNVDYISKSETFQRVYNREFSKVDIDIENDKMNETAFIDFLTAAFTNASAAMKPGAVFYIFFAEWNNPHFRAAMANVNWQMRQQLVWVKNSFVLSRQDYNWQHEPIFYGWKPGAAHFYINDYSQTTVKDTAKKIDDMSAEDAKQLLKKLFDFTDCIREDRPLVSDLHPTMKPINLIKRLIENSSRPGEKVLDLFGGSGTTLIAAEQTERDCYMMEYSPQYVDAIIKRWENVTGQKAEKLPEV